MDDSVEKINQTIPTDYTASLLSWEDDNVGGSVSYLGEQVHQRGALHDTRQRNGNGGIFSGASSEPSGNPAVLNDENTASMERIQAFQMANMRVNQVQAATQGAASSQVPTYPTNQQVMVQQAPYGYVQVPQHLIHQQLAFNHQAAVASSAHQQQGPPAPPRQYVGLPNPHHQSASVVSTSTSSSSSTTTNSTTSSLAPISSSPIAPSFQTQHKPQAQLHPLAMQASSSCPTHIHGTMQGMNVNMYPTALQGASILPFMYNPLLQPGGAGTNPQFMTLFQAQQQAQMQHVALQATTQQQQHCAAPTAAAPVLAPATNDSTPTYAVTQPATKNKQSSAGTDPKASSIPPFMLFDAPVELRTNFLASQLMLNLPPYNDCNTVHYGMAVNGFHPQLNAQLNPVTSSSSSYNPEIVRLIDGRTNKPKVGRERNEREQKRAQKITELIEALRISMEKGGWKVEMKSKYHTLSTCADYVKHLIETTQNKEDAVEQAKGDLAMSERQLEEKIQEQSRSEPESVASSLTASTAAMDNDKQQGRSRRKRKAEADNKAAAKKASLNESSTEESSSGDDQGNTRDCGGHHNISLSKMSSSISDVTDSNRGSSDSGGDRTKKRRNRKQEETEEREDDDKYEDDYSQQNSSISSTAAVARGEGANEGEHGRSDVVIKIKKGKNVKVDARKKELTSMDPDFDLDYEEVFVGSNIPQLLATPSGRIIATNDFFLKATGLSKQGAARLTIFSIVKPDKLSDLFQIVAEALRQDTNDRDQSGSKHETGSSSSDGQSSGHTSGVCSSSNEGNGSESWDNAAITLPCISFPPRGERKGIAATHHPNPLYMTVTLMKDPDPSKRCLHCALTDCPGTNGQLGFITTELLELLFSETIEDEPPTDTSLASGNNGYGESNDADAIAVKGEHDLGMMMDD